MVSHEWVTGPQPPRNHYGAARISSHDRHLSHMERECWFDTDFFKIPHYHVHRTMAFALPSRAAEQGRLGFKAFSEINHFSPSVLGFFGTYIELLYTQDEKKLMNSHQ
jgi:hypothetical protein